MPAYTSIESTAVPLARGAAVVGAYRYQPGDSSPYQYLPNVVVLGIQYREGSDPGVARFRYVFNSLGASTYPQSFQDAMSVDSNLAGLVANDQRLVVLTFDVDGSPRILFDGFAQVPEMDLTPTHELVSFVAYGVAIREWDTPIGGALMRDADEPKTVSDIETDLDTQFNPRGEPNATPEGADATDDNGNTYATFLDPLVVRSPDVRRPWTLAMAARYLCYRHNPTEQYVKNPDGAALDALLDSRSPAGGVTMQPGDPGTYQSRRIIVPDSPMTGKAWPAALRDLLESQGFGMAFRLNLDRNGEPTTALEIFRLRDGSSNSSKDIYLQSRGSALDPGQSNVSRARLARDTTHVANAFVVESELVRYESSFILAPGFAISPGDAASATSLGAYDRNDPMFSQGNHDKYRLYVFDETGEGHWDWATSSIVSTSTPLSDLFTDDPTNPIPVVKRRRLPLGELFTTDANQKPLKAQLSISTNYTGTQPGLWDGSGAWQTVIGGFELLPDRLGIWINASNPNGWNIGASRAENAPYPAGVVRAVESQAVSSKPFALRLTCVIEGDHTVTAAAGRRPASTTTYAITRRVDARDRYFKYIKGPNAEFNATGEQVIVRDDTADALAEADARRLANESGEVTGCVTIPRFTAAYRIGDRIRTIRGRDLSLRTNAGAPSEEGEVYPAIVGLTWDFEGGQSTILQLSDARGRHA